MQRNQRLSLRLCLAMAWAGSSAICSSIFNSSSKTALNTTCKVPASPYIPSPSKLTKRTNYLRKKLLKTLPKPFPPIKTLENPQKHLDDSIDGSLSEKPTYLADDNEEQEEDYRQEQHHSSQSPNPSIPETLGLGSSALYFFGLFIVQTLIAVWIFGSVDYEEKSGTSERVGEIDGSQSVVESGTVKDRRIGDALLNRSSGFFGNVFSSNTVSGEVPSLDESKLEEKISEIRIMAREARACEKKKPIVGDLEDSEEVIFEDTDSRVKNEIQEQVNKRLRNLKKNIHSSHEKSPQLLISSLNLSDKLLGGSDLVNLDEPGKSGKVESKKQRKFKSPSAKPRNNPRGFNGSMNYSVRTENEKRNITGDPLLESKSNANISGLPAMDEDESYWLRDDVLRDIVSKIRLNEKGKVEPFSGLNSEENMKFFRALERKFEREGESAKRWMEMKIENIDLSIGGIQQINPESHLEGSEELYEIEETCAHGRISDITNKIVDGKDIIHPSSEDSSNDDELLSSSTMDLHASSQEETQISESGSSTNGTGIENDNNFQKDFENCFSFGESSTTTCYKSDSQISKGTHGRSGGSLMGTKSRELETHRSPSFTIENQDTSTSSGKQVPLSSDGSSKPVLQTREVESKILSKKVKESRSDIGNALWWRNLPYVLAIFLHRGSDLKGSKGLYSLKSSSLLDDEGCLSWTIAFQDRGDASNFCYLLESFFEDLVDFSADVVPLSELDEAVKSGAMKLVVVRKGQLQLYAGQPLAEVEMALRSIFE